MLRPLYRFVLHLHPAGFRRRFAEEMLSMFDDAAVAKGECLLLLDGLLSVARQWLLRPEFWGDLIPAQESVTNGVPSFYAVEPFRLRTPALIHGLLLSVALFWAVCYGIKYSWIHVFHVRIPQVQFGTFPSSQSGQSQRATTFRGASLPPRPQGQRAVVQPLSPHAPSDNTPMPLADEVINSANSFVGEESSEFQPHRMASAGLETAPWIKSPVRDYIGRYVVQSPHRLTILISDVDGHLLMNTDGQPKSILIPVSAETFTIAGKNQQIKFVRGRDGGNANKVHELQLIRAGHLLIAQRQ